MTRYHTEIRTLPINLFVKCCTAYHFRQRWRKAHVVNKAFTIQIIHLYMCCMHNRTSTYTLAYIRNRLRGFHRGKNVNERTSKGFVILAFAFSKASNISFHGKSRFSITHLGKQRIPSIYFYSSSFTLNSFILKLTSLTISLYNVTMLSEY